MAALAYTLVSEGSSDRVLLPLLNWALAQTTDRVFVPQWADLSRLRRRPRSLAEKILGARDLYPCSLLFVHRDADRETRAQRVQEIRAATTGDDTVCVVPIRTQEAWFLFNETALRLAAGNPSGRNALDLPALARTEAHAEPKATLHHALIAASGFRGRKRRDFPVQERIYRLADLIDDFSPLQALSSFRALQSDLSEIAARKGWANPAATG